MFGTPGKPRGCARCAVSCRRTLEEEHDEKSKGDGAAAGCRIAVLVAVVAACRVVARPIVLRPSRGAAGREHRFAAGSGRDCRYDRRNPRSQFCTSEHEGPERAGHRHRRLPLQRRGGLERSRSGRAFLRLCEGHRRRRQRRSPVRRELVRARHGRSAARRVPFLRHRRRPGGTGPVLPRDRETSSGRSGPRRRHRGSGQGDRARGWSHG